MIFMLRYWLPLLIWMVLIFSASADTNSTQHTSRLLEPFLRWLNPNISLEAIDSIRWFVRKAAHMTEYAIMAWLAWRAVRRPRRHDARPWSWTAAGVALVIVIVYAATDEIHQTFVPNRTGSWKDVCIDTAGGILGLMVVWVWQARKRSRRRSSDSQK
jgi:VanZ family protein